MSITTTPHGRIWPAAFGSAGFVAAPAESCPDCASVGATLCTELGESLEFPTREAAAAALADHAVHGCRFDDLEDDHADALAENEAHDLAMEAAQELSAAMLVQFATQRRPQPGPMPQALRSRLSHARSLTLVPPVRPA